MAPSKFPDVASRLGWARSVSGLSAYALSNKAGLTPTHVALIESGRRQNIEVKTAKGLAAVLGIHWAWLLTGEGPRPTEAQIRNALDETG